MAFKSDCRSCGAPMWMVEVAPKKWHPFDRENDDDKPQDGTVPEVIDQGFTSHFDTCPDAAKHRRK